jgi:hypothetical protein
MKITLLASIFFIGLAFCPVKAAESENIIPVPKLPKPSVASEKLIQDAYRLSTPIVDAPIVRTSKGCIAYLLQAKDGTVGVAPLYAADGKPVCRKEFSYTAKSLAADRAKKIQH